MVFLVIDTLRIMEIVFLYLTHLDGLVHRHIKQILLAIMRQCVGNQAREFVIMKLGLTLMETLLLLLNQNLIYSGEFVITLH
jgi:hypothetical protein